MEEGRGEGEGEEGWVDAREVGGVVSVRSVRARMTKRLCCSHNSAMRASTVRNRSTRRRRKVTSTEGEDCKGGGIPPERGRSEDEKGKNAGGG